MAYTKQTWADLPSKNTPINAERLTHIEDGIYSAAQTADTAASTAGTAAANVGIVSGKVETLTERVNGLDTAVSNKVDKVTGKGLSTNDYDDTDKSKVDSLGTASTKNSTSVVTDSTDLVESGAVKDIVGWGNKNKLKFDLEKAIEYNTGGTWSGNTFTKNGVTFTVNADDSISLARVNSSTQSAIFVIDGDFDTTAYEGYIFNGYNGITPSDSGVSIRVIEYSSNDNVQSLTDGATIINNGTPKRVAIRVASSFTPPQGSVVKPMISKDGGAFEPYHASVEESLAEKCDNSTIAPTENGSTASQAYAVGEHFIRNGAFCTVTQAISSGGTLTEGTNYTSGDVADAVNNVRVVSITPTTVGDVSVNYPTGFDMDNTVVVSIGKYSQNGYRYGDGTYSANYARDFVTLESTGIKLSCLSSEYVNVEHKIVIMRLF